METAKFGRHSKGFALRVAASKRNHFFGGSHSIKGADCLNCKKPLILHFTIDCQDDRLEFEGIGLETIPLLYCMRCELSWYDFVYEVHSPESIFVVQQHSDPNEDRQSILEEWNEVVGVDEFPKVKAEMFSIPPDIEGLFNKWNASYAAFTTEEEDRLDAFQRDYLQLDNIDFFPGPNINQVGGRSLLIQGLDDPVCGRCKKEMPFLASLKNEKLWDLRICWDPVQIVFFFCRECKRVHVQHSI